MRRQGRGEVQVERGNKRGNFSGSVAEEQKVLGGVGHGKVIKFGRHIAKNLKGLSSVLGGRGICAD